MRPWDGGWEARGARKWELLRTIRRATDTSPRFEKDKDSRLPGSAPPRRRYVACSPGLGARNPLVAVRAARGARSAPLGIPAGPRSRPRNTEDRVKPGQAAAATTKSPTHLEPNKHGQDSRIRQLERKGALRGSGSKISRGLANVRIELAPFCADANGSNR
jgi:hypothetical protein